MKKIYDNEHRRQKRKFRIRKKIFGTSERPRVTIFKSNKYTYLQVIDDQNSKTLLAVSNIEKDNRAIKNDVKNVVKLGELMGEKLKKNKITKVVFDRNGYLYHGRVKAVAEGIRKAGIQF